MSGYGVSLKRNVALAALLLASRPAWLAGQAIVEHAVISGGVATVAGSAKSAASAISGTLKNLDGTLDKAAKKKHDATAPARSTVARAGTPVDSLSKPAKVYEDAAEIRAGISYAELLRRFGEPSMQISSGGGEQTIYYSQKDGRGQMQVRVSGGQVASVDAKMSESVIATGGKEGKQ